MTELAIDERVTAAWAGVVDDHNPLHVDAAFAATTRFGGPIAHGSLLFALVCDALQQAGEPHEAVAVRFRAPVPVGSTVRVEVRGTGARLECDGGEPVEVEVR
ncbi:MaoC family dehydratase [Amycolatopsis thermophila]|uniref:Acyl dehydratase n=1 Tax=Amycolatopsis thermophila TaxID=206084 RepID=A0ABU0F2W1_9PSEU|nr:MaoC family dehydratase [Amycolatopsis thermophila]MDQ0381367.1 acyl dehydratase [Amycolatopsis thermophila]